MLAHGALFGIVPVAALSVLGRTGNAVVGVLLGRSAGGLLSRRDARRPSTEHTRGADLVRRWGLAAVLLTRPGGHGGGVAEAGDEGIAHEAESVVGGEVEPVRRGMGAWWSTSP